MGGRTRVRQRSAGAAAVAGLRVVVPTHRLAGVSFNFQRSNEQRRISAAARGTGGPGPVFAGLAGGALPSGVERTRLSSIDASPSRKVASKTRAKQSETSSDHRRAELGCRRRTAHVTVALAVHSSRVSISIIGTPRNNDNVPSVCRAGEPRR